MINLTSKTPVKFTWTDDLSETAVILSPDDNSETLRNKLQRVLELETGQPLPVRTPGAALAAAQTDFPELFDAAGAEAQAAKVGWEALAEGDEAENLPEY